MNSGVLLVSFPCFWRTVCKILQPMESKAWCVTQSPRPCWPIRSKGKTRYTPLTLLGKPSFALQEEIHFFNGKSEEPLKNFLTIQPRLLFRPTALHKCQQKLFIWWSCPFNADGALSFSYFFFFGQYAIPRKLYCHKKWNSLRKRETVGFYETLAKFCFKRDDWPPLLSPQHSEKGVWQEIFDFRFFHGLASLGFLSIPIMRQFLNFMRVRGDIHNFVVVSYNNQLGK